MTKNERRARRFLRAYGCLEFVEWTQEQPCAVCGMGPCETAHVVRSKGAGGGPEDCAPLCFDCHHEQHAIGVDTFQARYAMSLPDAAANHWREWLAFTGRGE